MLLDDFRESSPSTRIVFQRSLYLCILNIGITILFTILDGIGWSENLWHHILFTVLFTLAFQFLLPIIIMLFAQIISIGSNYIFGTNNHQNLLENFIYASFGLGILELIVILVSYFSQYLSN